MKPDALDVLTWTESLRGVHFIAFNLQFHETPVTQTDFVALAQMTADDVRESHQHSDDSSLADTVALSHLFNNLIRFDGLMVARHGLILAERRERWLGFFLQFVFHIVIVL